MNHLLVNYVNDARLFSSFSSNFKSFENSRTASESKAHLIPLSVCFNLQIKEEIEFVDLQKRGRKKRGNVREDY